MAKPAPRGGSDGRNEHFTTIEDWRSKWEDAIGISHATARVMERMAYRVTYKTGSDIRPSTARIAHQTGISVKNIQGRTGHIAKLVEAGWLVLVSPHTSSRPATYRLGIGAYGPEYTPRGPLVSGGTLVDEDEGVPLSVGGGSPCEWGEGPLVSGGRPYIDHTITTPKTSSSPSSLNSPAAAASPEPRDVAPGTTSPTRNQPRNDDDDESTPQPPNDLTNIPWPTEPTHDPDATPPPEDDSDHPDMTITSQAALEEGPGLAVRSSGDSTHSPGQSVGGPLVSGGTLPDGDPFQQLLDMWPNPRAKTRGSIPLAADEWDTTTKTHQPHTLLTAARAGIANRSINTSTFINAWLRDYAAVAVHAQPVFVCVVCRDRGFVRESWSVDGQPVKAYRVACPGCATQPAPGVTVCVRPEHAKGSLELAMSA